MWFYNESLGVLFQATRITIRKMPVGADFGIEAYVDDKHHLTVYKGSYDECKQQLAIWKACIKLGDKLIEYK